MPAAEFSYLRGMSTGDFHDELSPLLGKECSELVAVGDIRPESPLAVCPILTGRKMTGRLSVARPQRTIATAIT
jgi:hypothetical protein